MANISGTRTVCRKFIGMITGRYCLHSPWRWWVFFGRVSISPWRFIGQEDSVVDQNRSRHGFTPQSVCRIQYSWNTPGHWEYCVCVCVLGNWRTAVILRHNDLVLGTPVGSCSGIGVPVVHFYSSTRRLYSVSIVINPFRLVYAVHGVPDRVYAPVLESSLRHSVIVANRH